IVAIFQIFLSAFLYNKRLLGQYSRRETKERGNRFSSYTLGKKYQIIENLRAFRLISFVLLTGCFFSIVCLPLAALATQSDVITQVFLRAAVDLFSTLSLPCSLLAGIYSFDEWREKFVGMISIRRRKETSSTHAHSSAGPSRIEAAEGEVYFNHLRAAW
ncbi:hypothetical protein PFISCL1PPCAC_2471, partial [Pristionchus fissidentatus]